jgi:hypothetical protein
MKRPPPKSTRYCMCCKDETTFKYDHHIGHSRCTICGWHYIPSLDVDHQYTKEKEIFEIRRTKKIPTEMENQRNRQIQILKQLKSIRYRG